MSNTNALNLGASNSAKYAYIDSALGITSGNITMELWVKAQSAISSGEWFIIDKSNSTNGVRYAIRYEYNSGTPRIQFARIKEGVGTQYAMYTHTLSLTDWTHIAITYDGSTIRGYVNGSEVTTGSASGTGSGGTNKTRIGNSVTSDSYASVIIDDVRIWNTQRSETDINNNKSSELVGNESGLVAYWKFNNSYDDTTSNAYNLTSSGSPTFSSVVPFGGGASLDVLIIAGGGSGASTGGGGGAGGMQAKTSIQVNPASFSITIGSGGTSVTPDGTNGNAGNNSSAFEIESIGGGGGQHFSNNGTTGGSGGGGGYSSVELRLQVREMLAVLEEMVLPTM